MGFSLCCSQVVLMLLLVHCGKLTEFMGRVSELSECMPTAWCVTSLKLEQCYVYCTNSGAMEQIIASSRCYQKTKQ